MKKLLNLLLLLIISTSIFAQKGIISGKIVIPEESKGSAVNVGLIGTSKGTITKPDGIYEITGVTPGNYILEASFVGLKTEHVNVKVASGEKTRVPDIIMEKTEQEISEIQVVGNNSTDYRTLVASEALKMKTPLLKVPQNIQVITKGLLDDQQAVDMLENVTRNTSGAMMIEHWGTFASINMRGFKLPAFRNGFNVDLPWGPLTEDISLVDRIEFVKGPAGFMLSSGEPGGLYNVVTKKPQLDQLNEVSLLYGSFNTLRATADINGKLNESGRLLYRLNVMGLTKRSHRDYEYNKRYSFAPSLKYIIDDRTTLTAEYIYQHSELSVVGAAYVFSPDGMGTLPRDYTMAEPNIDPTNMREHNAFLTFTRKLSDNWDFTAKISYLDYQIKGSSLWADSVTTAGIYRSISIWDAISFAEQGQVYVNGTVKTGPVSHTILAGLDMGHKEYYADWFQSGPLAGPNNPLTYENPVHFVPSSVMPVWDRTQSIRKRAFGSYFANQSQSYSALYVQDELGFFKDRLLLTLAGRYTYYDGSTYGSGTSDNVFTPRAGLNFTIDKNTSVYALYDQSFIPQAGTTKAGKAFDPVRGNDIEFGIKRNWANNSWTSSLTYYVITKENVLTTDPSDINFSIQLGEAQSKGFEFDVQGEITKGLQLILNYANTDVKVTKDTDPDVVGTRLAGHAHHMTNGWLKYKFDTPALKGFGLALGYQYQIDRSTWTWAANNKSEMPDYFRLDGALSWEDKQFSVGLNVYNLLDEYLYSGAAYSDYYYWQSEPGINFRLNVKYRF